MKTKNVSTIMDSISEQHITKLPELIGIVEEKEV